MVDNMAACKLVTYIIKRYAHLTHHYHYVICKVCNLIYSLCLIVSLTCDNNLGAFLANLFEYLIQSLFKKIGGV